MRCLIETFINYKLSIFKKPDIDPVKTSEFDIENVYEPDQLLDSDEEGDKDEDVKILFQRKSHSFETFSFCLNKRRSRISAASKKSILNKHRGA